MELRSLMYLVAYCLLVLYAQARPQDTSNVNPDIKDLPHCPPKAERRNYNVGGKIVATIEWEKYGKFTDAMPPPTACIDDDGNITYIQPSHQPPQNDEPAEVYVPLKGLLEGYGNRPVYTLYA